MVCDNNRWTSPQLDDIAAAFRADAPLKRAVSRLKCKFMGSAEALIHGDLHTGSNHGDAGRHAGDRPRVRVLRADGVRYRRLRRQPSAQLFSARTATRRRPTTAPPTRPGCWRLPKLSGSPSPSATGRSGPSARATPTRRRSSPAPSAPPRWRRRRDAASADLFTDTLQFAGTKMIRRILGIAHNIDFEWIEDPDRRAGCERPALLLGRELLVNAAAYPTIQSVTDAARESRPAPVREPTLPATIAPTTDNRNRRPAMTIERIQKGPA